MLSWRSRTETSPLQQASPSTSKAENGTETTTKTDQAARGQPQSSRRHMDKELDESSESVSPENHLKGSEKMQNAPMPSMAAAQISRDDNCQPIAPAGQIEADTAAGPIHSSPLTSRRKAEVRAPSANGPELLEAPLQAEHSEATRPGSATKVSPRSPTDRMRLLRARVDFRLREREANRERMRRLRARLREQPCDAGGADDDPAALVVGGDRIAAGDCARLWSGDGDAEDPRSQYVARVERVWSDERGRKWLRAAWSVDGRDEKG